MSEEMQDQKKKGSKTLIIVIIGIIFFLFIAIGFLVFFLIYDNQENSSNTQVVNQQNIAPNNSSRKINSDYINIGPIYPLDQFVVNLISENGSRFLKTKIDLEESNENLMSELNKKKALIRDMVIRTLSSKTYEEISTSKGKDRLKEELVNKLNNVLIDGYIKNIYFTDFVIQ